MPPFSRFVLKRKKEGEEAKKRGRRRYESWYRQTSMAVGKTIAGLRVEEGPGQAKSHQCTT